MREHACSVLVAVVVSGAVGICVTSCSGSTSVTSPTTPTASNPTTAPTPAPAHQEPWFNLQVGDCVQTMPAVDEGDVDVGLVDCHAPHQAEVYQRAPIPVDAAITDIANQKCAAAFTPYTAQPVGAGPLSVTYLIDSNQDRTADNPLPSTVICLLQAVDGADLTASARH